MVRTKKSKEGEAGVIPQNEANPANSLRDNSVSASEMADKLPGDGKGKALLAADAGTAERIESETSATKAEEDNSAHARLSRSGYVLNEPQGSNDRWVGESIQKTTDPARVHLKTNCRVTGIAEVKPWTGLRVEPIGGSEPFTVPEEFGGKDATPAMWLAIIDPKTGKSFIE